MLGLLNRTVRSICSKEPEITSIEPREVIVPINDSRLVDVKISGKRFTPKTRVDVIGNAFVESSSHISVSELRAKVRLYGAQDMEPIELIVVFNVPPGASVATASMVPITVIPGPPIDIEDEIPF